MDADRVKAAWIVRRLSPQRPQRPTTDADEVRVRPLMDERMSPEWRVLRSSVDIDPTTAGALRMGGNERNAAAVGL